MTFATEWQAILADQLALGEAETVTYLPYAGTPREVTMVIVRHPPTLDFVGGAEVPVVEYEGYLAADAALGVLVVQDGKDQVSARKQRGDLQPITFRVVSHRTGAGAHTITMRA